MANRLAERMSKDAVAFGFDIADIVHFEAMIAIIAAENQRADMIGEIDSKRRSVDTGSFTVTQLALWHLGPMGLRTVISSAWLYCAAAVGLDCAGKRNFSSAMRTGTP